MWKLSQGEMMVKAIAEKNNKDHSTDLITSCWPVANSTASLRSQPNDPEIWPTLQAPKPTQLPQLTPHFAQYPSSFLPQFTSQFSPQIPSQLAPLPNQFASPSLSQFPSQLSAQFPSQLPSQSYAPVTLQTLPHPSQSTQPPPSSRLPLTSQPSQKPSMSKTQSMTIVGKEEFDQMNNCQLNSRYVGGNIVNDDGVKEHNNMINQQVHVDRQLDVVDQINVQHTNSEQFQLRRHQQLDNPDLEREVSSQQTTCFPPPPGLSHSKIPPESGTNYTAIHDDLGGMYNVNVDHLNQSYGKDQGQQQLEMTNTMTDSLTRGSKDRYHKKSARGLQNAVAFSQSESSNHTSNSINSMTQTEQSHHQQSATVPPYWNNDTGWHRGSKWKRYDFDKSLWTNPPMAGGAEWSSVPQKVGSSGSGSEQTGRMEYRDNHETWKQDLSTGESSSSYLSQQPTVDNNRYRRNNNKSRATNGNEDQEENIRRKAAQPLVVNNSSISSLAKHLSHLDTNSPTSISLSDRLSPFPVSQPTTPIKDRTRSSTKKDYSNDLTDSGTNGTQDMWPIGTQLPSSASTPVIPSGKNARPSSTSPKDPNNKISYKSYGTNFVNQSIWSGDLSLWVNSPSNKKGSNESLGSDEDFSSAPRAGLTIRDSTHPPPVTWGGS